MNNFLNEIKETTRNAKEEIAKREAIEAAKLYEKIYQMIRGVAEQGHESLVFSGEPLSILINLAKHFEHQGFKTHVSASIGLIIDWS